ncbi:PAS domain-containing protein [Hymenobacter sp. BT683]|uniref:histidine kinase n=1 Tax=Hymenobacter jeongseonensis TaxID=2791027 RepID=A0ABS0IH70_9BACT|nr:PAS domain-containing protein [Hymenobacter jeongseonensis]MBF9237707.1 PAS domain-containing protein [Hymenobacter jeongseonensis]
MPESTADAASIPADLSSAFPPDDLLRGMLETSLTGVGLYTPVRAPGGEIVDFTIDYFNPVAQQVLHQPARPAGTYLEHFPHTRETGVFDFHCRACETDEVTHLKVNYQGDGLDNYFHLSARRVGQGLLVSFSDTADHSRTAVEVALRESQVRERAALAEAERQRAALYETFMQAPAMICIFAGPEHVFELVNPHYQQLVGNRPLLGRPIREAMPELTGQPIFGLLDQVFRTGETFRANEMLVQLDHENAGIKELEKRYYNFIYQARRHASGAVDGIIVFAYEVTEQVRARQLVAESKQALIGVNEELAAANEELQAANEEIRANNDDLFTAQLTLRELNGELEARVADRTARLLRAQSEAEKQRARLERFFMQAPAAICILDGPDLRFELVNPSYQALFPGRLLNGRPIRKALPELADHAVLQTFQQVYETGQTHQELGMLIPIARPADGELEDRYFNYIQQARYDEDGRIDGIMVFAFEVTEQVRASRHNETLQAEALEAAEQLVRQRETLQQVFEQTPALVFIARGPEHFIEYVNPAYQSLFPGRVLKGQPTAVAIPEAVEHGFIALLDHVYTTSTPYFGNEVLTGTHDTAGKSKPRYLNFTYQAYQENGVTVGVSSFAFDVTEQVQARQQAASLQQEVARRDAQLQDLFEQAPVAIAVVRGPELIVELANPVACELWGLAPAEVLGKPLEAVIPELEGQRYDLLLRQVMRTGETYSAQEQPTQLRRNGQIETVYLNLVYQALRETNGEISGVASVVTDVSEQVAAREMLARANAELVAANQAVGLRNDELATANQQLLRTNQDLDNFVYAASHDLKQPVNNLAGLVAEVRLAAVFNDPEEESMLVPMVDDALRQLSTTIDDLAAVGQAQRLPDLPAETVPLDELTQEVLQTLQPQVQAARARVTTDFAARPTITYARANLRTILLNLLSNALKYADPARPARVHLSLWVAEGRPVLLIEDNGLGFDVQRHRGELFHLFRRFHDHTEGTGVGLYLVNRIVQGNGGRIEVESEVGEGTTFRVFL